MPWSILLPVAILIGVLGCGTLGFVLLERLSWIDALYLTAATVSTVGYGDVVPVTAQGKLFAVALILGGVGTVLYLLTALAALVFEGRLRSVFGRSAMKREIETLEGHVIVCGFGRFGRAVADELAARAGRIVIVDSDPETESSLQRLRVPYLIGSGLDEDVLEQAGIKRARALVICTASDSDNVFITLSARELNPGIRIHARAETESGMRRLRLAGAHQVVSAYQIGGMRIAASIDRPSVVDFLEISTLGRTEEEIALEEVRVDPQSPIVERAVGDLEREQPRLRIVALKRGEDALKITPDAAAVIHAGDLLIVFGERASLEQLAQLAQGRV